MLENYLNYIAGIVGAKAMLPVIFTLAIAGPIIIYQLVHKVHSGWLNKVKWLLAILTFFSCLILFISTGGYIGLQFEFPAIGMGLGLVLFYYSYNGFTALLPSTCPIETKSE